MTSARLLGLTLLAALLTPAASFGQCVSTMSAIAQPQQFPNHVAASQSWSGLLLGVAKDDSDVFTRSIWFAAYDRDLVQVIDDHQVAATSLSGAIALIWTGGEFALFYETPQYQLVLQRVSVFGDAIGSPIAIAPDHAHFAGQEFDIVWDNGRNAFDIARSEVKGPAGGLWLTVVQFDGKPVFDQLISQFVAGDAHPRIASASGGRIGILWLKQDGQGPNTLTLGLVDATYTTVGTVAISTNPINWVLASNGSQFLIIASAPVSGGTELRSALVNVNLQVVSSDKRYLQARGMDVAPVALTWNASLQEWALVYADSVPGFLTYPGETRLRRFAALGAQVSDTLFATESLFNILQARGVLVPAGNAYFGSVSRFYSREDGSSSYLVKWCTLAVSAAADRKYAALFAPVTFNAPTTGGIPGYTYLWDFGDLSTSTSGPQVTHAFTHNGTYTVTVTAFDTAGAFSTATVQVVVSVERRRGAKK